MGRKGKKKQDDDDDYFASLVQQQQEEEEVNKKQGEDDVAAPAENEEEEEEDEEVIAAALAERDRVLEDERAAAKERAEKAERARLAMSKRNNRKKSRDSELLQTEDDAVAQSSKDTSEDIEEEEDDASEVGKEQLDLGLLGQILLKLRPYTIETTFWAIVFTWLYSVLSHFAGSHTLQAVDAQLALTDSDAAARITQENERKKRDMLWCPVTRKWSGRIIPDPITVMSVFKASEASAERWTKNLKTKAKQRGTWTKVKDGDGWASAPNYAETASADIPSSAIRFFTYFDSDFFDCTSWATSSLGLSPGIVKELDMIDALRPLFTVARDENGFLVADLHPKFAAEADRLLSSQEAGNNSSSSTATSNTKKEKLSRADKKAKKLAYRR